MSKTYFFEGWLHLRDYPADDGCDPCIFLDENKEPSEHDLRHQDPLFDEISHTAYPHGRTVFVRWWSADRKATKEVLGVAKLEFGARYSDVTGYLWTDNEFKIGGHDMNVELGALEGKWVCFEIEVR